MGFCTCHGVKPPSKLRYEPFQLAGLDGQLLQAWRILHPAADLFCTGLARINRKAAGAHSACFPLSASDTCPVQAAVVLGRMHPAHKVTVDVGGAKELEIPQDRPEPLANMSATVQQVRLALCHVRRVGCWEGMRACKAVQKHLQTGCATHVSVKCTGRAFTCCVASSCQPLCRRCDAGPSSLKSPACIIICQTALQLLWHPLSIDCATCGPR